MSSYYLRLGSAPALRRGMITSGFRLRIAAFIRGVMPSSSLESISTPLAKWRFDDLRVGTLDRRRPQQVVYGPLSAVRVEARFHKNGQNPRAGIGSCRHHRAYLDVLILRVRPQRSPHDCLCYLGIGGLCVAAKHTGE
jgi:hypothetical protein